MQLVNTIPSQQSIFTFFSSRIPASHVLMFMSLSTLLHSHLHYLVLTLVHTRIVPASPLFLHCSHTRIILASFSLAFGHLPFPWFSHSCGVLPAFDILATYTIGWGSKDGRTLYHLLVWGHREEEEGSRTCR
jgi:hypothetical protein